MTTTSPPSVLALTAPAPEKDVMSGARYEVVGAMLRWPSIVTTHVMPAPAPTTVLHEICVCAIVSTQPAARNSEPVRP